MKLSIRLVGMHFRPPAKQVLMALPMGTEVSLIPEPDNQYDSNAVRVVVDMDAIASGPKIMLDAMLAGTGHPVPQGQFMLGYLAASGGKAAKGGHGNVEALMLLGDSNEHIARIAAAVDGAPTVEIDARDPVGGQS